MFQRLARVSTCSAMRSQHNLLGLRQPITCAQSRTFFNLFGKDDEKDIQTIDLNKLTTKEQYKAISLKLLFKQYGLRFGGVYGVMYATNLAGAYAATKIWDLTVYVKQAIDYFNLTYFASLLEKYPEAADAATALIITDSMDVVRVPLILWYAIRYLKSAHSDNPRVYKKNLPEKFRTQ